MKFDFHFRLAVYGDVQEFEDKYENNLVSYCEKECKYYFYDKILKIIDELDFRKYFTPFEPKDDFYFVSGIGAYYVECNMSNCSIDISIVFKLDYFVSHFESEDFDRDYIMWKIEKAIDNLPKEDEIFKEPLSEFNKYALSNIAHIYVDK